MSTPFTGGCACGALHYEIPSQPVAQLHCQCRDCQRMSGTGHASWLAFMGRKDVTLKGKANTWDLSADSGNVKTSGFCGTCGSPVYMTFAAMPDLIAVHAASLDDPSRFAPHMVTYDVRKYPWDRLDPSLKFHERMPKG